jgi:hypothetical protein
LRSDLQRNNVLASEIWSSKDGNGLNVRNRSQLIHGNERMSIFRAKEN